MASVTFCSILNLMLNVSGHLFQIPESHMLKYIQQVLGVILALLEDANESVQLTAVQCLLTVSSLMYYTIKIGLNSIFVQFNRT
jgi:hypothetical protein